MSRERRKNREAIVTRLQPWYEAEMARKAQVDAESVKVDSLFARLADRERVAREMREVRAFNIKAYREADPERMAYHLLEQSAKAALRGA